MSTARLKEMVLHTDMFLEHQYSTGWAGWRHSETLYSASISTLITYNMIQVDFDPNMYKNSC